MGNWYFVRQHPIYAGLPVNQVMGFHYQTKGRQANGLLIEKHPNGADIEIIAPIPATTTATSAPAPLPPR